MPFLFHAQKKSIFDLQDKTHKLSQFQVKKIQQIEQKKMRSPQAYSINVQICKDHPFRKINRDKVNQLQEESNQNNELFILQKQKIMLKYTNMKAQKSKQRFQNLLNQLESNQYKNPKEENFNLCIQNISKIHNSIQPHKYMNKFHSLNQVNLRKAKSLNGHSQLNKMSNNKKQRPLFQLKSTPGPGQYQNIIKQSSNHKSLVSYKSRQLKKRQLTNQYQNQIKKVSIQQHKKQDTCQTKASLNEKIHKAPSLQPKNKRLLNLILSKSKKQTQQVLLNDEQQYQVIKICQPSPNKYDIKSQFCKKLQNNKNIFISGADRLPAIKSTFVLAQYLKQAEVQVQSKNDNIPFLNTSIRELHFDNQGLCKQQFYYSPKNNLIDTVKQKNRFRTKNYFGSSLQRFQNIDQNLQDSYKYSSFKIQQKQINPGVCFKFTEKRQLFKDMLNHDFVGPKYHPINGTIQQKTQKEVFKILLKSKFKDEVINMKKKKQILEEQIKNIKNSQKMITSSKPKQIQNEKKEIKKNKTKNNNICFGQNAQTKNERRFKGKQQFDGYYESQLNWNIQTFNKHYQYY